MTDKLKACREAFEKWYAENLSGKRGVAWMVWQAAWNTRAQAEDGEAVALWVDFADNGNIRYFTQDPESADVRRAAIASESLTLTEYYTHPPRAHGIAYCRQCGDGIIPSDPGICGTCCDTTHPLRAQEAGEAVAWIDPETGDVITSQRKSEWTSSYGAGGAKKASAYTIPLYTHHPRAQEADEDTRSVSDDVRDFGTGITVDGKRVCPTRVVIHRKGAGYLDDARDAARYRWLKRGCKSKDELFAFVLKKDVDAAIDAALSAEHGEADHV